MPASEQAGRSHSPRATGGKTPPRVPTVREHTPDDLTKKAQIVDAAILEFAGKGAKASVRTIAAAAGVSPGLITHHFGSKDALRRQCDNEVLRRYEELKLGGVADPLGSVGQVFDDTGTVSILVCYMIRSFLDGGAIAQRFIDQLQKSMRAVVDASLAKGLIKPALNEDARIRYLAESSIGAAIVRFVLNPPADITQAFAAKGQDADILLAQVELMTEGVFTDRTVLDAVKAQVQAGGDSTSITETTFTANGSTEPIAP